MFSITSEVRAMYLDSKIYFTVAKNLSHVSSIAVNGDYIYCSNRFKDFETIVASTIIEGKQEAIVTQGKCFINNYSFCKVFIEIIFYSIY